MPSETSSHQDRVTPADIKLQREEHRLTIRWRDGHTSRFDLPELRKACPCAACNAERQRKPATTELFPILKKDPGTGPPQAVGAKLVGHYALHLAWSDGHDTGIYDFRFLRELDRAAPEKTTPR
jgi:DUF971 family protein